ncbi:MAG: hypothetical protein ACRDT4_25015 [Micromonosporaceae bacterium]
MWLYEMAAAIPASATTVAADASLITVSARSLVCRGAENSSAFFRFMTTVKSQARDGLARLRTVAPELGELVGEGVLR